MLYVSAVPDVACTRPRGLVRSPADCRRRRMSGRARPQDLRFCTREPQRSKVRLRTYFGDQCCEDKPVEGVWRPSAVPVSSRALCSSVLQAASVRAPWKRARGGASLNRSIGLSVSKRVCVPTDMREKITPPATARKRGRGAGAAGPVRGAARGSRTPSSAATCAPRASCGGCAIIDKRRGRGPSAAYTFYIASLLVDHIKRRDTARALCVKASGRGRPSSY